MRQRYNPFPDDRFEVKPEHIKLIQQMNVGWQDAEFGAPEIDPKRPYGNSDVIRDICEILYPERLTIHADAHTEGDDDVPDELHELLTQLHRETEHALEVCLRTMSFEPGVATKPRYTGKWTREASS